MINLVRISAVSTLGVAQGCSWYPWMPFVHMLAIAVFIGVTGIVTMLGTVEFDLVPFLPLGIFLHAALILIAEARVGCASGSSGDSIVVVVHFKESNLR